MQSKPVSAMRRMKKKRIDPLLSRFGVELIELSFELHSYMISERLKQKAIGMVTTKISEFLQSAGRRQEQIKAGRCIVLHNFSSLSYPTKYTRLWV